MGKELLLLGVGQYGINSGSDFMDLMFSEHGIDPNGKINPLFETPNFNSIFFQENKDKKYSPRSCFIDLEPESLNYVRRGYNGNSYDSRNLINGNSGSSNNWTIGHYGEESTKLIDNILDSVRKQVEKCDCLQGFLVFHSLEGGTGSGLGTLIQSKLREDYPDRVFSSMTHLPNISETPNSISGIYNTVLSMHQLIENLDLVHLCDNPSLTNIIKNERNIEDINYHHLNELTSYFLSTLTSSMRFGGDQNIDLRKFCVNLILFPRLHFFEPLQYSHPFTKNIIDNEPYNIISNLFQKKNSFFGHHLDTFTSLTNSMIFRGNFSVPNIELEWSTYHNKNSSYFTEFINQPMIISQVYIPPPPMDFHSILSSNSSTLQKYMEKITKLFISHFKRKSFIYHYLNAGLDEMEFAEAEANLNDLISEYKMYFEIGNEEPYNDEDIEY